jgi:hypothetical protein
MVTGGKMSEIELLIEELCASMMEYCTHKDNPHQAELLWSAYEENKARLRAQLAEIIKQRDSLVKLIKDSKLVDIVSWRGRVGLTAGLNSFWSDDLDDSDFDWLKGLENE